MAQVIKAPNKYDYDDYTKFIFLGGSIEMGVAENWQDKVVKEFQNNNDITFLSPRRDDWDSSWTQDPIPGTKFHEQVQWELIGQERADLNIYYFDSNTKSPITLLELGLFGPNTNTVVRCEPSFYRYGNVKITCDRYNIPLVHTFDELIQYVKEEIQ